MASAALWPYSAERLFFICSFETPAGVSKLLFHGRGRGGKQQVQRRFLRKRGAAGKFLAGFQWAELPQSKPDGFASSLWEGAFGMAAQFLIASETLATGLTACALSVKAYGFASSPKGRAKSTAGNFLITLNTLATSVTAWLSPWESWRGSA